MAHLIETAVFSKTEGAGWTKLGQVIPHDIANDPRRIAALCGATFEVLKTACYMKLNNGEYAAIEGREVLTRSDTHAMLEVVSDTRYHVDNRQPADIFEAFRDDLAKQSLEISHAAVLDGGRRLAVCALLPSEFNITIGKSDTVKYYVTLSTGYDKKNGTKGTLGSIRVVCANTLGFAIADADKRGTLQTIRASTVMESYSLTDLLAKTKGRIETQAEVFNTLANAQLTTEQVQRYFADVLEIELDKLGKFDSKGAKLVSTKSENMLRELSAAYSVAPGAAIATGTAWGALNAVTYYATHIKTCRDSSGSGVEAARVASNLNGDAAKLKLRALNLAAQSFAMAA